MNKKTFATLSLILAIISILTLVFTTGTIERATLFVGIGLALSVISIVFGFIGKSEAKGLSIAGIIIGILSFVLVGLSLIGLIGMKNATDCVDNGNGTSKCVYMGTEIEVPNNFIKDSQWKK